MSKKFQLQIPDSCHESWDKMTPGDKGRFCDSCQKTVHDFTGMTDAQLIAFFKKPSTGSVCGRFYNDQLERDFEIPRKRIPWLKYFFQFAIPVFLTGLKSYSQGKPMIKENNDSAVCTSIISGDVEIMGRSVVPILKNEVLGKVIDENGKGIPYASITVKGSKYGVMCDSTGFFQLKISDYEKEATLIASCIGYSEQERQIDLKKADSIEITLSPSTTLSGEVVVTSICIARKGRVTTGGYTTVRIERRSYLQKMKDYFVGDSIKVFPNPVKAGDQIKIEWRKAETGEYKIDLYSLQGQLIKSSLAKIESEIHSFTFQIPTVTSGSYLLRMINKKSGKKYSEKIIIQ